MTGDAFEHSFRSSGPGRYRLQLQRGSVIEECRARSTWSGGHDRAAPLLRREQGDDHCDAGRRRDPQDTRAPDVVDAGGGADVVLGEEATT